jgi:uncharacterized protein YndB with AHSA1/START domain
MTTTTEVHEINGTHIETVVDPDTDLATITFTRIYDAPPELLFECLTTPEHLATFWGPEGTTTPVENITVELEVGGLFETIMVNDESGEQFPMRARFTKIDPPRELAYAEEIMGVEFRTTMRFEDLGDGRTRSVSVQENVPAMFRTEESRAGMTSSFVRLDRYLAGLAAA